MPLSTSSVTTGQPDAANPRIGGRKRSLGAALALAVAASAIGVGMFFVLSNDKKPAAVDTSGRTLPYVPTIGRPEYRPGSLGYSVDGGRIYYVRKWLSYGERSAKARATWDYNACKPSCVNDKRTRVRFAITLTDRKPCRDVTAYTTLTVSQSSNTKLLPNRPWTLEHFCS